MGDARSRLEWNQTAELLAAVTNAPHWKPPKQATAADFNPHRPDAAAKPRKPERLMVPMRTMRALFVPA